MTSTDRGPKGIVRRWVEEMVNGGDLAVGEVLFAPELVDWAQEWVGSFREAFPDVSMQVDEILSEGVRVVGRFRCSGTHLGAWHAWPPTGRGFRDIDEVYFFTVVEGRITELWALEDNLTRRSQLGLLP